jgi:hypothetical protein
MNKDLALAITALGNRGFSVDMIKRIIARDTKQLLQSRSVIRVLEEAGIADYHDAPAKPHEMGHESDPGELRARWEKLLPDMKARIRASMGAH